MTTTDTEPPTSSTAEPALLLEGVRKVYRVGDEDAVALDHADLEVADGEIVALVGPDRKSVG